MESNERPIRKTVSGLLAVLLLLVAMAGRSWPVSSVPVGKDKTEQSDEKVPTVGELSLHAVVTPSLSFAFAQSPFVLPRPLGADFREKATFLPAESTSFYYFSYLRHVFGHHIAPNGP